MGIITVRELYKETSNGSGTEDVSPMIPVDMLNSVSFLFCWLFRESLSDLSLTLEIMEEEPLGEKGLECTSL